MINGYGSILTSKNLPADQQLQLQPRVAPITQEPKTVLHYLVLTNYKTTNHSIKYQEVIRTKIKSERQQLTVCTEDHQSRSR